MSSTTLPITDLGPPQTFTAFGTASQPNPVTSSETQAQNPGPSITERTLPSVDRFYRMRDLIFKNLRVHVPAIVQSFNPAPSPTVSVVIATNETQQVNVNGPGDPNSPAVINLQTHEFTPGLVLYDVPVQFLRGGGWNATLPIKAGDECLLAFSDTALDSWFQNGGSGNTQIDLRRHSLSDAIAIFGLCSRPNGFANWNRDAMELRNDEGTIVITLADGQITISAPNETVQVNAKTANVVATETATVQGDTVNIKGASSVDISGATTIQSRLFLNHTHSGVSPGHATSGPVFP